MTVALVLRSTLLLLLSLAHVVLATLLFSAPVPLRGGWGRVAVALGALAACHIGISALLLGQTYESSEALFTVSQFGTYSILLVACVAAFVFAYDTSVWTALFCCSAGYTVQNLSSGATELAWFLVKGSAPDTAAYGSAGWLLNQALCVAAIYGVVYALVTRRILETGIGRIENRFMLAMMVAVMLVIIGFDLLVKWITAHGAVTGIVLPLRLFHGLMCVFTLIVEFELLITDRLEAERDTMRQILAERERQYGQARENVAAISARVHDIRHAVARIADADGMNSAALRELVHEVEVYDLHVNTGNEALDTVLTERGLVCARDGVTLSCIADGSALSFMAPADVYALFGGLIDAAVSTGATSVSIMVREALGAVSAHVECNGALRDGSSLKPLADIASRYGTSLASSHRDGNLHLNILFPAS